MFNNNLVRTICTNSNEKRFQLSKEDWNKVLNANSEYSEDSETYDEIYKSRNAIGKELLNKVRMNGMSFSNSLELCCGSGYLYFVFEKIANYDKTSYFIDISAFQCEQFRMRIKEDYLINNITVGDISKLAFADESLDTVYGHSFLHHLPDVPFYINEFKRVLKKNGTLILFHEPNKMAAFFQSFPVSLYKNVQTDSLTDVWVFPPSVLSTLIKELGFSVKIFPLGLFSSILLNPLFIIMDKVNPRWRHQRFFVNLKTWVDKFDKILPSKTRLKYSPSVAYICKKI